MHFHQFSCAAIRRCGLTNIFVITAAATDDEPAAVQFYWKEPTAHTTATLFAFHVLHCLLQMLSLLLRPHLSSPLVGRSSRCFAGVSVSVIKEKLAKGLETDVVSVQDTSGGACMFCLLDGRVSYASSKHLRLALNLSHRLRRFLHGDCCQLEVRGQINGTHERDLITATHGIYQLT